MPVPAIVLLASLPLRAGCAAGDAVVATLEAGTPVEIRFAIADGSSCFKIAARVNGEERTGYVHGEALNATREFERERAAAGDVSGGAASATPPMATRDPALARVSELIQNNQANAALRLLEPLVDRYPKRADILMLAGMAAERCDRGRDALAYWKRSLELEPNEALARAYRAAQREEAGDESGEKLIGSRFALRYEGERLPPDSAREILAALDSEYGRIAGELGCPAEERITAVVQSREAYRRTTGAAEWSGGRYDGRTIRVALLEKGIGPATRRTLAHEIVHACVAAIPAGAAPWPAWLHEGLAQKLSGDRLGADARAELRRGIAAGSIPKLERVGQNWSRLSADEARVAYNLGLAAVEALYESGSGGGIRNVLRNPERLPGIAAELDKALGF